VIVDLPTLEIPLESEKATTVVTPNPFSVKSLPCTAHNPRRRKTAWPGSPQTNPCIHLAQIELGSVVHPPSSRGVANEWRLGDNCYISLYPALRDSGLESVSTPLGFVCTPNGW